MKFIILKNHQSNYITSGLVLIGNMNWLAFSTAIIVAVTAIVILLFAVCYNNQRTYYTNEENSEGKPIE